MKRSVRDYPVAGKRVFVRVDFNVPVKDGRVSDDTRIRAALPTITYLLDQGCAVVLASHLGRPKGQVVEDLRMAPVAARLAELLGRPVQTTDDCVGPTVEAAAQGLGAGGVLLLENLRFHAEETANDPAFAAQLATLAEVYVNDAFGTAHRAHASTEGIARHLPAVAGLLMLGELESLGRVLRDPARPFVVLLGGLKVSDKISLIQNMLKQADTILVGGAMANAFLKAQGHEIGASKGDGEQTAVAAEALAAAAEAGRELLLPVDVVVAPVPEAGAPAQTVAAGAIPADADGPRHRTRDGRLVRRPPGGGRDGLLERPHGPLRGRRFRRRHKGGRRGGRRECGRDGRRRGRHHRRAARLRARRPAHACEHGRRRVDGVPRGASPSRRRGAHGR